MIRPSYEYARMQSSGDSAGRLADSMPLCCASQWFLAACVRQLAVHVLPSLPDRGERFMAVAKTKKKALRGARLDIRLNSKAKEKIEQAAAVSHQSITDFVVTSLLRASEEALERQKLIQLTNRDRDLFLAALETDVRPSRALRNAAERFKRSAH